MSKNAFFLEKFVKIAQRWTPVGLQRPVAEGYRKVSS